MRRMWTRALIIFGAVAVLAFAADDAATDPSVRGFRAKTARPHAARPGDSAPDASGYYVPYVTVPSGEKVPVMDIPGSVTVVPRQLMDDQQATSLCDALRNVSGVFCR